MSQKEMMLLGDEAVSYGGFDAGVKGFFAYPGTPSTEIMEGAEVIVNGEDIKGKKKHAIPYKPAIYLE